MKQRLWTTAALAALAAFGGGQAAAATGDDGRAPAEVETLVVTGSHIARQHEDLPAPLQVIDAAQIQRSGAATITDVVRLLNVNSGSQFNTDERNQGGSTGTSNFNLRGLGLAETLVLVNGHRQITSLAQSNDVVSFVDVNSLTPLVMLKSVEVLKDGAAAIYGSDAVAGVVNLITLRRYEGLRLQGEVQTNDGGAARDAQVEVLGGRSWGPVDLVVGASYLTRRRMTADQSAFSRDSDATVDIFSLPGAFGPAILLPPVPGGVGKPTQVGTFYADPACGAGGTGGPYMAGPPGSGAPTFCQTRGVGRYLTLVPEERRLQAGLAATVDLSGGHELRIDAALADNRATRADHPSFPLVNYPFVPSTNPGFATGAPAQVLAALAAFPFPAESKGALFFGRVLPFTSPPSEDTFRNRTASVTAELAGPIGSWRYDLDLTYARSTLEASVNDVVASRFYAALRCQGGPSGKACFNPFGNSLTAQPGSPLYNSPDLIAYLMQPQTGRAKAGYWVAEAGLSGVLAQAPAGPVELSAGAQFRGDARSATFDPFTTSFDHLFLYGRANRPETRQSAGAGYLELAVPLTPALRAEAAVRYERYNGDVGASTDPKIALLWRPSPTFSARATYSTAFRAPQTAQLATGSTSILGLIDPRTGGGRRTYLPVLRAGNPKLQPETSTSWDLGATWRPVGGLQFKLDYWRFRIADYIVPDDAQDIIAQNLAAGGQPDPRIVRGPDGAIQRMEISFDNAAALETAGLDLEALYDTQIGGGDLSLAMNATYVDTYRLSSRSGAPAVERVGRRNYGSVAAPLPPWRVNLTASWSVGPHRLTGGAHYIDAYLNDEPLSHAPADPMGRVKSWTTFDLQYSLALDQLLGGGRGETSLAVGAVNLANTPPPFAATADGLPYDTRVADPRGRMFYLRISHAF